MMRAAFWTGLCWLVLGLSSSSAQEKTWEDSVDRAIAYLRKTQAEDGSWGAKQSPGITGIVMTGLIQSGRLQPRDPML
ncbi:MAG: hypothetical protein ACKO23_18145, partial [Gemmataceae bacterium]